MDGKKQGNLSGLIIIDSDAEFVFEDGEVSEVTWIAADALRNNILQNPDEYANRLGALTLLEFYKMQAYGRCG